MLGDRVHISYKQLPEDEGIDRIELAIEPRYKTSGMSGDEWRVSTVVRFYRKGELLWETSFNTMQAAIGLLMGEFYERADRSGMALWSYEDGKCMQPSCPDPAQTEYLIQNEYSDRGEGPLPKTPSFEYRRRFCLRHARRGDSDLEDQDSNYVVLGGVGPAGADIHDGDESPAARMDVHVRSVEDVPGAVRDAIRKQQDGP